MEKGSRIEERVQFEKELNGLSVIFLEAKDYYKDGNLKVKQLDC